MTLKEFLLEFKEIELDHINELILDENDKKEYKLFLDKFCDDGVEDRDVILEDLRKDQGYLYTKMVEWNESDIVTKLDLNMVWYEYSLEDFFRDSFCDLFDQNDINNVLYDEGWDE